MIASLVIAAVLGATAPQSFDGVDLLCGTTGASLRLWTGTADAPSRVLVADATTTADFQVDLDRWTVLTVPTEATARRVFGLSITQAIDGGRRVMKTSLSCRGAEGQVMKLRMTRKGLGVEERGGG